VIVLALNAAQGGIRLRLEAGPTRLRPMKRAHILGVAHHVPSINQLVASSLGIPEDRCVSNIERYGNTTAATIPIGLSETWEAGKLDGTTVLMAAFGSGYTWAGAVVQF
jgi:3-oxoacyl-[acyl-carrier-protein] synthase III